MLAQPKGARGRKTVDGYLGGLRDDDWIVERGHWRGRLEWVVLLLLPPSFPADLHLTGDVALRLLHLEYSRDAFLSAISSHLASLAHAKTASIEAIRALLPDVPLAFLSAALDHPAFASRPDATSQERLTQALFETSPLPAELEALRWVEDEVEVEEDEFDVMARARREQAAGDDGVDIDFAQISLGKGKGRERDLPAS